MSARGPIAALALAVLGSVTVPAPTRSYPERPPRADAKSPHVQRTLRRLAERRGPRRKVRVLFYGQSFTEQGFWRDTAHALRRSYPHADLEIQNRALGGYPAQLLVKTAVSDVLPYYPDLVVLHAFGAHDRYEEIIRAIRSRTTAEVLIQNDYVMQASQLEPPSSPELLRAEGAQWDAFMNYRFLPQLARHYGAALCDHRGDFQRFLRRHGLAPGAMLVPDRHLNPFGEWLVHQGLLDCLRPLRGREAGSAAYASEAWIRDHPADDLEVRGDRIRLVFSGNRVDALLVPGGDRPADVWIDGARPSEHAELYAFGRARATPGGKWPVILRLSSRAVPLVERWRLELVRGSTAGDYSFSAHGSRTGFDGQGTSKTTFVSNSGRLVIEPEDWSIEYALSLAGIAEVPERLQVDFAVHPLFVDRVEPPRNPDPTRELLVTLAQGLADGWHVVELARGPGIVTISGLRVYSPPGVPQRRIAD